MKVEVIAEELARQYPDKNIIFNPNQEAPTEILCEVEPTTSHEEYSCVIAVIDEIAAHYHEYTLEEYHVLRGELSLTLDSESIILRQGDSILIPEKTVHSAFGKDTWIMCTSTPGWTIEDHILVHKP